MDDDYKQVAAQQQAATSCGLTGMAQGNYQQAAPTWSYPSHTTLTNRDWRVRALHYVAKAFGILIKIDGIPLGSRRILRSVGHFDNVDHDFPTSTT